MSKSVAAPFFSVAIVNFNCGACLLAAVNSFNNQTFQDYESFIVYNTSTDGPMDALDLLGLRKHIKVNLTPKAMALQKAKKS